MKVNNQHRLLMALATGPHTYRFLLRHAGIKLSCVANTLSLMKVRGWTENSKDGWHQLTVYGEKVLMSLVEEGIYTGEINRNGSQLVSDDQEDANGKRGKKTLHWIVTELFELAQAQNIGDQALSDRIYNSSGIRIPKNTLRYWKNCWSEPKISEVDLIANALGHELDLMLNEGNQRNEHTLQLDRDRSKNGARAHVT